MQALLFWIEALRNELFLFAAFGFCVGGLDDLLMDLLWVFHWAGGRRSQHFPFAADPESRSSEKVRKWAIFVPAWQEAAVICDMVSNALASWEAEEFDIFAGCYRNDQPTIQALQGVADARLRLVISGVHGPTTKADCLNRIYGAMRQREMTTGETYCGVILHDAEDLVHPCELAAFRALIDRFGLVQLPVLPLQTAGSRWVSGHYLDEFAQAHSRDLLVRNAIGAGLPAAGVGCALSSSALANLAEKNGGKPFAIDSLTEDYELGLRLAGLGFESAFVRLVDKSRQELIATRAHFPDKLSDAVRQKARWTIGIALAGWDRLGWSSQWIDNWMRWRDRRAIYAALILVCAYTSLLMTGLLFAASKTSQAFPAPVPMLYLTSLLLVWRLSIRALCVGHHYGWRCGLISVPRTFVSNIVAMLAARDALIGYTAYLRTGHLAWNKTRHRSPLDP